MKDVERRLPLTVLLACSVLMMAGRCDKIVTIKNPDSLPALKQKQDFTADYTGRDTDIQQGTPPRKVPYDRLDTDIAVGLPKVGGVRLKYWAFGFERRPDGTVNLEAPDPNNPDDPLRAFHGKPGGAGDSLDWDKIVKGNYHCSPTTGAMVLIYWAKEKAKPNLLQGLPAGAAGEVMLISKLAQAFDTNDQNTAKNKDDHHGFFGTWGADTQAGITEYGTSVGVPLTVEVRAFDFAKYKTAIDKDQPVILVFRNPGSKIGHVVVGYGYKGDKVLFKDPWDGSSSEVDSTRVVSTQDISGAMQRRYGQLTPPLPIEPSSASSSWIDVVELVVGEITP